VKRLWVRRALQLLAALLAVLVVALAGFLIWASTPLGPMPEALAALQSGPDVEVQQTQGGGIVFRPVGREPAAGFVFYPGGRVDARSYAPQARAIAREGYLAVIVPMPLNFAVFGADRASGVIAAYPTVPAWAIGGHSLGGAMAAQFANRNPQAVRALALWAAYPAGSEDLSPRPLSVISVYGTNDGVATPQEVLDGRPRLPPGAVFIPIEGGNHAYFGWYGPQSGDGEATISREAQQAQTVAATVDLLRRLTP
jgi:hypothetical protein